MYKEHLKKKPEEHGSFEVDGIIIIIIPFSKRLLGMSNEIFGCLHNRELKFYSP